MKKKIQQQIRKLFNLYTEEEIGVGVEFGVILSETASNLNLVLSTQTVISAERIYAKELKENGVLKTALNFIPLIMAIIEEASLEEKKTPSK